MDLNIYKIDLDTDQPNGGKGESPRSAFTKYNNSLDTINSGLTTLGENVGTINSGLTTLGENVDTINSGLTTLDDSAMKKADNLSGLTDASTARNNLGLGGAATRNVGTSYGQLMEVGAFGLGGLAPHSGHDVATGGGFGSWATEASSGLAYAAHLTFPYVNNDYAGQLAFNDLGGGFVSLKARVKRVGVWWSWVDLLTSSNTTVDGNGFVKKASPVIKLFVDCIETNDFYEVAGATFSREGVGIYRLEGVPPLACDGWYIETPKDRNGNIYFYLDYEEDEDNNTLTIKTYEPDYSTGRAEAGEPVDIPEGRFVSLRFEEDPSLYPELEEPKIEEEYKDKNGATD